MSDGPTGLDIGEKALAYIETLRQTWPRDDELASKHGVPAEKRHSQTTMSGIPSDSDEQITNATPSRRTFMRGVGAAATVAVLGTGHASAAGVGYGSGLVQDPMLVGSVTIDEHQDEFDELDYIADDESTASLTDAGARVAHRDEDDEPHNPVTVWANNIAAPDYTAFPRDVTREDEDGDEEDVSALDAQEWVTDASASAGTITVEDDGDALRVLVEGQGAGDTTTATFDNFTIDSGEARKYLQMVSNIDNLPAGTVVTVRVVDVDGDSKEFTIDSDADGSADDVIATAQGAGQVFQAQLGDIATTGDGDFETIESVEIAVDDADLDLTLHGLNLERADRWQFGTREYLDEDDEVDTETVYSPSGAFSITTLSGLDTAPMAGADIEDVTYDIEVPASKLDEGMDHEWTDADRYDQEHRLDSLYGWDLPSQYALDWDLSSLVDTVLHPGSRYIDARFATGLDEVPDREDIDDMDWTNRTSNYSDASIDDEITITSAFSASDVLAMHFDVLYTDAERDDIESSAAAVGPTDAGGSGGRLAWLFSLPGMAVGALSAYGLGRYFGVIPGIGGS